MSSFSEFQMIKKLQLYQLLQVPPLDHPQKGLAVLGLQPYVTFTKILKNFKF